MAIYALLIGHFVADFVCQSDWMAVNKSKRWDALGWHVGVYAVVMAVVVIGTISLLDLTRPTPAGLWAWVGVNAAAHFVQDAITSRLTSRLWFFAMKPGIYVQASYTVPYRGTEVVNPWTPTVGNRHWFFVAIGFDQLLHYVTLFVTAGWWLR